MPKKTGQALKELQTAPPKPRYDMQRRVPTEKPPKPAAPLPIPEWQEGMEEDEFTRAQPSTPLAKKPSKKKRRQMLAQEILEEDDDLTDEDFEVDLAVPMA